MHLYLHAYYCHAKRLNILNQGFTNGSPGSPRWAASNLTHKTRFIRAMKVKMYIRMDEINYRNMFSVIIYSIQIVIFII